MALSRPVVWIFMIASVEYWKTLKGLQSSQVGACYIPSEEAMAECEPFVYSVGSSLQLNCNSSSVNITAENVTNLQWFKDEYPLDTRGLVFSKENLSIMDSGNYTCQLSKQILSSDEVLVGERPHSVPEPKCVSRILGEYNCSWDEGDNFNLATRYQLQFHYQQDHHIIRTCTATAGNNFCEISSHSRRAGYFVIICAENCLGHSKSSGITVDPHNFPGLKISPPSNIAMLPVTQESMNVTFDLPEGWPNSEPIRFYMNYTQSCTGYDNQAKVKEVPLKAYQDLRGSTLIEVTDQPYSNVCVQMASYFSKDFKPERYSDRVCAHSLMRKPSAFPEHFKFHFISNDDNRTVKFTWQELDPCKANGIIRRYILNLTSGTHNDSFDISGNLTSFLVPGLSWQEEYQAKLYAVNDAGISEAAMTIVPGSPSNIPFLGILSVILVSAVLLCIFLSCCRLYFKVKKRVLPKVPDPVYYNNPFMTQVQYSHLSEPEVFDELRTCNTSDQVQTSNSGETALISATTTSQDSSEIHYAYSRFGSSIGSSTHTGSRDFSGLQAARPVDVQHNAYTSYPGSSSSPPAVEDRISDAFETKDKLSEEKEDPDGDTDDYARFALFSEDEVFIHEKQTPSHQNQSKGDEEHGDDEDPLITDSRGLSYSSVTEVAADNVEESPNISDTNPAHIAHHPSTFEVTESQGSQSGPPWSHGNISDDGSPSLINSSYQPHTVINTPNDPLHCGLISRPGLDQNQATSGRESVSPYTQIVNRGQSCDTEGRQPSAGPQYGDLAKQDEPCDIHISPNSGSDLGNTEEEDDPYITQETLFVGSMQGDKTAIKLPQADSYSPHLSRASGPTSGIDPYISHDAGTSRSDMESCQALEPDLYVSHESPGRSAQLDPSLQDPYACQQSRASVPQTKSCHPVQSDPYISHESAVRSAQLHPSVQNPYDSQQSSASGPKTEICHPDPYISHESAAAGLVPLNLRSVDDPYVLHVSRENESSTNTSQILPDQYVACESAVFGTVPLNPTPTDDPYIPHESVASGSLSNTCQAQQPDPYISHDSTLTKSTLLNPSSEDPYVSHESAASETVPLNPVSGDPYIRKESGESTSHTSTCQAQQPDPYIPHDSTLTKSTLLNPSSEEPYILHESAATERVPLNPVSGDPYIRHESGKSISHTNTCQALQPDPYISHASAMGKSTQIKNFSSEDPYVSHESAETGTVPLNPVSEDDPYISHESANTNIS